jgi:hypothetical protein
MLQRFSVSLFFSFIVFCFFSCLADFSYAGALIYSTHLGSGSQGYDWGLGIAIDSSGNAYITGGTVSSDFPTTPGAFDTTYNGGDYTGDAFVTTLNPNGTALVYSTYLGGSGGDVGYGIAVDSSGNTYITGLTASTDFPTTPGAFDTLYNGAVNGFVSKLNPGGTALVYSTYLGGGNGDECNGIAIDSSGNAYITGYTTSFNFPITSGAFDISYNGAGDGFVCKLNPNGTALLYSTYLGGKDEDWASGIAIDGSGNAYITGYSGSTDFPTTPEAFETSSHGGGYNNSDAFVTKVDSTGTALVYSTYLGGGNIDHALGIAIDASGNAYITGYTSSTDFSTTPDAIDTSFNGEAPFYYSDVFVTKLNPSGTALLYSTYLGGGDDDEGYGIAVDDMENVYITEYIFSTDFPTTPDAFDISYNGSGDVAVTKLNARGTGLVYSTYLGGGGNEEGFGIAVDGSGNTYITGRTFSHDFPTTPGAFDTSYNGSGNAFVTKLSLVASPSPYLNSYGDFILSSDTSYWYFEKYGDGISAGILSWISAYQCISITQTPGEKGKITQVFSVPSTGWYTATARVLTDISNINQQQKVYLYLQQLNNDTAVVATGNQVIQPGAGGLNVSGWKSLQISFYATGTLLGVQVVAINNTNSSATGSLYIDDIWVTAQGPTATTPVTLTNPSFDEGTSGWMYAIYADGTGAGIWSEWSGFLLGTQAGGEKGKISQLYSAPTSNTLGSVWVYSAATSMSQPQKIYLYVYSYDSGYSEIIENGNAIMQPGKWAPGQWRQLQFGYTPFTAYNAVHIVAINPTGNPYQSIYFDDVELKQ